MFGPLGVPELLFILVLALLIFGPRKLPEIGRTVGKAMGEFRRASTELRRTINTEIALEDEAKPAPRPARAPSRDSESAPSTPAIGRIAAAPPEPPPAAPPAPAAPTVAPAPVDESGVATAAGATAAGEAAEPPGGADAKP